MKRRIKEIVISLQLAVILLFCSSANCIAQNTKKEKAVMAYYSGFETHDWNMVVSQFADDFTFTTPINDHISTKEFQDSCWGTNKYFKKVNFIKMIEKNEVLMLLVEINTTDNKVVRNIDLFTFRQSGKIKSIEVFFGAGGKYPGNLN